MQRRRSVAGTSIIPPPLRASGFWLGEVLRPPGGTLLVRHIIILVVFIRRLTTHFFLFSAPLALSDGSPTSIFDALFTDSLHFSELLCCDVVFVLFGRILHLILLSRYL